jgi:hypothetical protein
VKAARRRRNHGNSCDTVSFLAELLVDPASIPHDRPLRYRARTAGHGGGFVVEFRELWSDDRLVALNQQAFAVVK